MKAETEKATQGEMSILGAALERGKRFHTELKTADGATAAQLLAAWKELIMEEMAKLLRVTKDPRTLEHLDCNIAVGQEVEFGRASKKAQGGTA